MHPFDIIILVSTACCVGLIPVIYVKRDLLLAVGYCVCSTVGAFAGGFLALWYFPQFDKVGILFGGIFSAVLLVVVWHFACRDRDRELN